MRKENDYFLNAIANPQFTSHDFRQVGLTTDNTSMEDKSTYENIEEIRENPLFQTDGHFDQSKFDVAYENTLNSYRNFTDVYAAKDVASSFKFFRNNIWANNKEEGPEFAIIQDFNPLRQKSSIDVFGVQSDPEFTETEIAETQKSWDNKNKVYTDAPNDNWLDTLINPKVLAQWEYDADEKGNPTNDEDKIVFHKGELKLNENGTYYSETLNGRSTKNKQFIHVWDVFTKDGSKINKYDFFDSDDIEKSTTGTLMRQAVKVAPYFIPYVQDVYIPLMAGINIAEMITKMAKMVVGYDNVFLNNVEGMFEATSFSQSAYTQGSQALGLEAHPWSLENLITMGSDVFGQLAEQRWIFKYGPKLFGKTGSKFFGKEAALEKEKFVENFVKNRELGLKDAIQKKIAMKGSTFNPITDKKALELEYKATSYKLASQELEKITSSYMKSGEVLSKLYMTGITTADAYSEAKEAGASDWSAALFAMGYAAGEYGILSTDLGKWILPELRLERTRWKDIAKTLLQFEQQEANANPAQKRLIAQKIFNYAKGVFKADHATPNVNGLGKTFKEVTASQFANAIGEGTEEAVEEALFDLSKGLSNGIHKLFGSNVHMQTNWEDEEGNFNLIGGLNDYALNFVGGLIGGGLGEALPEFRNAMKYNSYINDNSLSADERRKAAYQELVGIIRAGKKNQFMKVINQMTFSNPYLSATKNLIDEDGNTLSLPGDPTNNQDKLFKYQFSSLINNIENILNITLNGQTINDDSFIDKQIAGDLRFNKLRDSATAYSYLQAFNDDLVGIVIKTNELIAINKQIKDNESDETLKQKARQLKSEINDLKKSVDDYVSGKASVRFKEQALFELNLGLSGAYMSNTFIQYAEAMTGKPIYEIPKWQLQYLKAQWDDMANMQQKDKVRTGFEIFKRHNIALSEQFKKNGQARIQDFNSFITKFSSADTSWLTALVNSDNATEKIEQYELSTSTDSSTKREVLLSSIIPYLFHNNQNLLTYYQNIIDQQPTSPEEAEQRFDNINAAFVELFTNPENIQSFKDLVNNLQFIDPDVKIKVNRTLMEILNELYMDEDNDYSAFASELENIVELIKSKYDTPILQIASQFAIDTNRTQLSELLENLTKSYDELTHRHNLGEFIVDQEQINNAILLLNQLQASVVAMRTDNVSYEQLAGYNATINELNGNEELATIDKTTANILIYDINRLKNQLGMFATLYNYNADQKLNSSTKLHHKNTFQFFNKAKLIFSALPKDKLNGYDQLMQVLDSCTFLEGRASNINKLDLSQEERVNLEKERIRLFDAIGDFINQNLDNLDIILSSDLFNLFQSNAVSNTLDNNDMMDDSAFIWKMYSLTALRASNFYNNYKDLISAEYASLPSQEEVVHANVAFLTDKSGLYQKFKEAINKNVSEKIKKLSKTEQGRILAEHGILVQDEFDNDVTIQFDNLFLNEGDPGTGKTTAVDRTTISYLQKYHPELTEDIIVLSNTEENAKNLAEAIGAKHAMVLQSNNDETSFMRRISPGYTIKYNDATGDLEVDENHLFKDNGVVKYNHPVVDGGFGKTKILIIDEASLISKFDAHKIDEWLGLIGAKAIISGDFNQQGITGTFKFEDDDYTTYLHRNMFGRTQKLGEIMRVDNSAKGNNNAKIKHIIQNYSPHDVNQIVALEWYQDTSGLYGDRVVNNIERAKETINLMLQTSDKPIHYLYDNINSELKQYIESLNSEGAYKNRFVIMQASASQGGEGEYYIIDLANETNDEIPYLRKFYTALTRAKKGSLIMRTNVLNKIVETNGYMLDSKPTHWDLNEQQRNRYSQQRKSILESEGILNPIKPKVTTTSEETPSKTEKSENPPSPSGTFSIDDGEEQKRIEKIGIEVVKPPKNTDENQLNMFMHTIGTNELGCVIEDGKLKVSVGYEGRIDGVNGLIQLGLIKVNKEGFLIYDNNYITEDKVITVLKQVQQSSIIESSKVDIQDQIKRTLRSIGLDKNADIKIRFGYKHAASSDDKRSAKFQKDLQKEQQYGVLEGAGERVYNSDRKGIYVEVYVNDKLQLEVPILKFSSPVSLLNNEAFKELLDTRIPGTNPVGRLMSAVRKATELEGKGITKYKAFVKAIRALYLGYGGKNDPTDKKDFFVFFNDNFIPSKHFKVTPPSVSAHDRGTTNYGKEGYEWTNKWITLSKLRKTQKGRNYSESIFVSQKDLKRHNGELVVPKGQMFVLVTDYNKGITDAKLVERFENELKNPDISPTIGVVLVSPPQLTVRSFLENLNKIYLKNGEVEDKPDIAVGTEVTVIHLLNAILGKDKYSGTKFELDGKPILDYFKENYNSDGKFDEQLDTIGKLVDELNATKNAQGRYTNETIQKLREEITINGKKLPISRKAYLNQFLRRILVSKIVDTKLDFHLTNDSSPGVENPNNRIAVLQQILESKGIKGIFYHINIKPDGKIGQLDTMDTSSDTFRDGEILCNVKPDSTILIGDALPLIEEIERGSKTLKAIEEHTREYVEGNYPTINKIPTYEEKITSMNLPKNIEEDLLDNKAKDEIIERYGEDFTKKDIMNYIEYYQSIYFRNNGFIIHNEKVVNFYDVYDGFKGKVGNIIFRVGDNTMWFGRDIDGNLTIYSINPDNSITIQPMRVGDRFVIGEGYIELQDLSGKFITNEGTVFNSPEEIMEQNIYSWTIQYAPTKGIDDINQILPDEITESIVAKIQLGLETIGTPDIGFGNTPSELLQYYIKQYPDFVNAFTIEQMLQEISNDREDVDFNQLNDLYTNFINNC